MRLTLINQFYTPDISPTAHLCASLAQHRANSGDEVTVLTSRTGYLAPSRKAADVSARIAEQETGTISKNKVRVLRLWSTSLGSRTNLRRLLDWASFYIPAIWVAATMPRQDVVIALTTPPFIAVAGWIHKLIHPSAKLILWNMDVYPEAVERTHLVKPDGFISRLMRSFNKAIFQRLNHLICLDEAMEQLLLSQYMPANHTMPHSIIPNWETAKLFSQNGESVPWDGADRPELYGKFVVLYLGNAGYGHEFRTVLDAAEKLREEPIVFWFLGGGSLRPWINQQTKLRGLTNIALHQYVPKNQTAAVMRRADCALITLENAMLGVMSPSKLHSNLAMGLPIIYVGPQQSNVDEAINRFGCGVSLRPGDAAGFVKFTRESMKDRQKHACLKINARTAFEEAYCDTKTLPQFDFVIDSTFGSLLGVQRKGPECKATGSG